MRKGNYVSKPVTIRGAEYPSQSAAARALGVSPSVVNQAAKYGWLDKVGVQEWAYGESRACRWKGVEYPSLADAARATGDPYPLVRQTAERL